MKWLWPRMKLMSSGFSIFTVVSCMFFSYFFQALGSNLNLPLSRNQTIERLSLILTVLNRLAITREIRGKAPAVWTILTISLRHRGEADARSVAANPRRADRAVGAEDCQTVAMNSWTDDSKRGLSQRFR